MKIVQNRKVWFSISGSLVILSFVLLITLGLNLNIDFTGGSLLEVEYSDSRAEIADIRNAVESAQVKL